MTVNTPLITDPPRKRGLSIVSSSSSHNSRLSNSPFLSSPLTSGICIVCLEKDIPPLNRLVRCAQCSSLYHQSCHSPALTKAILEQAGGNWKCRMCKQRQESTGVEKLSMLTKRQGSSGLSVTLKRANFDEKALEETVMTNKSSFSSLLQKHAAWKTPTGLRSPAAKTAGTDAAARKTSTAIASLSADVERLTAPKSQLSETVTAKDVPVSERSTLDSTTTPNVSTSIPPSVSTTLKSVSKSPQSHATDPVLIDVTFQEVSLGEAVPSVKSTDKAIPASQPSHSSQYSPNLMILEPTSPPVSRPRNRAHRKRDLVISDSEEELSSKRAKSTISPRAAMKSASATRPPLMKPAPLKLPLMSGSSVKSPELARKSGVMARKSGTKLRELETPTMKGKEVNKGELRSPISPITSIRHLLRQPSPIPAARPTDPGASQHYSLQLILSKGSSKNDPGLFTDNESPGFDYSTLYPVSLIRPIQPHRATPVSPMRKRSREKNNFDILSLVPDAAVPVIEDGKLAFREGAVDGRTGQLKRGARKFKVGRIMPAELL